MVSVSLVLQFSVSLVLKLRVNKKPSDSVVLVHVLAGAMLSWHGGRRDHGQASRCQKYRRRLRRHCSSYLSDDQDAKSFRFRSSLRDVDRLDVAETEEEGREEEAWVR